MILAIDAGNTRVKWGLHADGAWRAQGVLALAEASRVADVVPSAPDVIVIANVAGPQIAAALEQSLAHFPATPHRVTAQREQCGVINRYDNPGQLGADRWAALIGARQVHGGPCLVVGAGTATTVDMLDAAGVFQGGLILPGFDLMRGALAQNTAQLPWAEGRYAGLPRNTADAIVSGCLHAQAGAIERMFAAVAGEADALCLLSGGAAAAILDLLNMPRRLVDNLVLEGLARIGREKNL